MGRSGGKLNLVFSVIAVVLAGVALGGVFYLYRTGHRQEETGARTAIHRARSLAARIEKEDTGRRYAPELADARARVDDAQTRYAKGAYAQAQGKAEEALSLLRPIEGELETPREMARVAAVSGRVTLVASGRTFGASGGGAVAPGDELKAGGDGVALLTFPNQEQLRVFPGTSLRLDSLTGGPSGSGVVVTLLAGAIVYRSPDVVSDGGAGRIRAGGWEVALSPGGLCRVALRNGGRVELQVRGGEAEIESGSASKTLRAGVQGTAVSASSSGIKSEQAPSVPPMVSSPADGRVFSTPPGRRASVRLAWAQTLSAGVRLQVSRSPLFTGPEVADRTVTGGGTTLTGLKAGLYYWRLRATGPGGAGFWSWPGRFRVLEVPKQPVSLPGWRLSADATLLGDVVMVRGRVSPSVHVMVNDVEVHVDNDGTFARTFSLEQVDKGKRSAVVCAFNLKGNETCWSKEL